MTTPDSAQSLQESTETTATRNTTDTQPSAHLYEVIAQELIQDIEQGLYHSGQKIPSVRKLSNKRGVSISTVSQAYSLLEDRGIIQAKPQSGYFVKRPPVELATVPPLSMGDEPTNVTKGHLIKQILASCPAQ